GAGQAGQQPADTAIGWATDVDERVQQVSLGRCGPDVAREGEARANADRRSVHRGDDRLGHGAKTGEHRHVFGAQDVAHVFGRAHASVLDHLSHVGARRESATRAGQDDNTHRVVALGLLDRVGELPARERADGVHLLGPVETNPAHAAFGLYLYVQVDFSGHRSPSLEDTFALLEKRVHAFFLII